MRGCPDLCNNFMHLTLHTFCSKAGRSLHTAPSASRLLSPPCEPFGCCFLPSLPGRIATSACATSLSNIHLLLLPLLTRLIADLLAPVVNCSWTASLAGWPLSKPSTTRAELCNPLRADAKPCIEAGGHAGRYVAGQFYGWQSRPVWAPARYKAGAAAAVQATDPRSPVHFRHFSQQ